MNLPKLVSQLIQHEGLQRFPYLDTVGKLTIGCGHNLTDKGLTDSQIRTILTEDLNDTLKLVRERLPWTLQLDDVRQRALLDMAFNLGKKLFDFVKMLDAIKVKDWNRASDELLNSKFATQTGQRAKDLALMLKTGQDPVGK